MITPSWGEHAMKKSLCTFDIRKESAVGVSRKADSAYTDALALLSLHSKRGQERPDCSPGSENRRKVMVAFFFYRKATSFFKMGKTAPAHHSV